MKIVKLMVVLVTVGMISLLAGCQTDVIGPSMTMKVLYKGENDNNEYLSRNSGMATRTGYSFELGNFGKKQFSSKTK